LNIQSKLAVLASFTTLNSFAILPSVQAEELPFKESVQSQTTFMAKECSVQLVDPKETMEMRCDRLSVTEGDGTINFHYDDGDEIGFSFVLSPNDKPVLVNDKITPAEYEVIGTFMWTADSGIVDETLTEATGTCRADQDEVVCQSVIDTNMRIDASVKF
jgi:hypothetical protein